MQVILTHENADFDAIASLLGAHKLYPRARPVLPRRVNRNVRAFLDLHGPNFPFVHPDTLTRGHHIRRVILVDTQALTYVRGMSRTLDDVLILDHHTPPATLPQGWRFQGDLLGATTTLLTEAISTRLISLTREEATLLLAGIYEDTGTLTYPSTTARDLHAAAWLIERGASLETVIEFLAPPLSSHQQQIYEKLLENLETLTLNGHPIALAWAVAPHNTDEEISTLAHKLRDLLAPSALFILVEIGGNTQMVARSTSEDINVADVARHFGGRGHNRAAAAFIRHRAASDVCDELRHLLPNFVRPRVKVRDLMSHGVNTVPPDTPIAHVHQLMVRTGHEGFPVVDTDGRVVGLVTRNAVDRALQHQWDRKPVRAIMQAGEITVSPDESAERLRALMIQSGWGQIPVVEKGRLIGVVTRTDLIRMPPSEREDRRQEIARRIARAFPPPLLALIRRIGTHAAEMGYIPYFVGGIVRDLLLDHPISDVDLVVEGDAIALARTLLHTYGGDIRTHRRFGTAKWLLSPDIWTRITDTPPTSDTKLPRFIDLVTARTEFYEHPTALPIIARSSIKQDLHRRDFTINTLAIRLDPQQWGELLDFYGGMDDLKRGVIRVLHSLSFVDDPTRILRAVRFETRLGFHLDPRSEALIADALPMLRRITGGRIRHELELIFQETRPEAALERLQALGALQEIDPALHVDTWHTQTLARLRRLRWEEWNLSPTSGRVTLTWMILAASLPAEAIRRLAQRLLMPNRLTQRLLLLPTLPDRWTRLADALHPGDIADLLDPLETEHLAFGWLTIDDPDTQARILTYAQTWRHVRPILTGDDLKAEGIPPGPIYRRILHALRTARLNGEITTRDDELNLARQIYAAHTNPGDGGG